MRQPCTWMDAVRNAGVIGLAGCSEGEGGGFTFSHIWIANTDEGTVSKIDTQTGVERRRYARCQAV